VDDITEGRIWKTESPEPGRELGRSDARALSHVKPLCGVRTEENSTEVDRIPETKVICASVLHWNPGTVPCTDPFVT
jgi:hypothetical protein